MNRNTSHHGSFADVESASDPPMHRTHLLLFGRKVHRGTLLIALMLVLGAGWVLWESRSVGPKNAAADSGVAGSDITMQLDQMRLEGAIGTTRDARKEQLFGPLRNDTRRRRIRLQTLPRSPFGETRKKEPPREVATSQPAEPVVEETPPELGKLDLQSILIGASPTAVVNGVLIQEGQFINDWKVVKIQPENVILQWRTRQRVLTMP